MRRLVFLPLLAFTGCTHVFFQPSGHLYSRPEEMKIKHEAVRFPSLDGTELTGLMLISSGTARGTVIHFHGNAENMTSHYLFSAWLTTRGYNVFVFDYRGYGGSKGEPSEKGLVEDGIAALRYVKSRKDVDGRVAVWAQSLGAAVALAALGESREPLKALLLEGAFDSYRDMAEDVLSRSPLTWALQWPLSRLLISDRYKPARYLKDLPSYPVLVVHSREDRVVPQRFGKRIYSGLREPKELWIVEGEHLQAFQGSGAKRKAELVEFFDRAMRR